MKRQVNFGSGRAINLGKALGEASEHIMECDQHG